MSLATVQQSVATTPYKLSKRQQKKYKLSKRQQKKNAEKVGIPAQPVKTSSSDLEEKAPLPQKGKASVKGANGSALAETVIQACLKQAEAEESVRVSSRAFLKSLHGLKRDDHLKFREALDKQVEGINSAAKACGMTVRDYKEANPKSNSVAVQCSLWKRLSLAVEKGYSPDFTLSWSVICQKATEFNNSEAKAVPDGAGEHVNIQQASPTIRRGRPEKSRLEKAKTYMEDYTSEELAQVKAWIESVLA